MRQPSNVEEEVREFDISIVLTECGAGFLPSTVWTHQTCGTILTSPTSARRDWTSNWQMFGIFEATPSFCAGTAVIPVAESWPRGPKKVIRRCRREGDLGIETRRGPKDLLSWAIERNPSVGCLIWGGPSEVKYQPPTSRNAAKTPLVGRSPYGPMRTQDALISTTRPFTPRGR